MSVESGLFRNSKIILWQSVEAEMCVYANDPKSVLSQTNGLQSVLFTMKYKNCFCNLQEINIFTALYKQVIIQHKAAELTVTVESC